ncbi:MAG: cytochrome c [Syntrophobacteraceae bacterium]
MKVVVTIIVFLAVAAGAGAVYVWFGFFNVSARVPHWDITLEAIEVLRDRSIIVNSRDVKTPPLADPALVPKGAALYQETCIYCHGAPGISAQPFSQGLYPAPADLLSGAIQNEWKEAQLYWIVENGLKLTGMPAFGSSYEKDEIAAMIAFVRRLPKISPGEYAQMAGSSRE